MRFMKFEIKVFFKNILEIIPVIVVLPRTVSEYYLVLELKVIYLREYTKLSH